MSEPTTVVAADWTVIRLHGRWMASHPEHGHLRDRVDGGYPAEYDTREELLEHLGVPS